MPLVQTEYKHIVLREDGIPIIAGTTTKVEELIVEMKAWGWGAEKTHEEHPYLSRSQIHAAFAYYWEHSEEIDRDIERRERYVEELRRSIEPSPSWMKLLQ